MNKRKILKAITTGSTKERKEATEQLKGNGRILFSINGIIDGLGITESEARQRYPDAIIFVVPTPSPDDHVSDPIE